MKVFELRAFFKGKRRIRGLLNDAEKSELEARVRKIQQEDRRVEYERQLRENVLCHACLTEQKIQRKIDEKTHNERLLESTIRILFCDFCQHAEVTIDGDHNFCTSCGTLRDPDVVKVYRN